MGNYLATFPPIQPLTRDNLIGTVLDPPRTDFVISFMFKPFSIYPSAYTSMIRFTNRENYSNGKYGDRVPGLFLYPNTLRIKLYHSSTRNFNENFTAGPSLKMNERNSVKVEYNSDEISLYINGVSSGSMSIPINNRPQLNQWVIYASDKYYNAADADIEDLTIKMI